MRVVFFGTPAFAVPTLDALLSASHTVVGVVTQPDRPRGRGQKTTPSPVKAAAVAAGLPVLQPASAKTSEFGDELGALSADVGVVAAYGQILTQQLLDTPQLGMVNVHASLLPRYRGAAPVHRAVINGDAETGVTIMKMVKALDAGPMLAAERLPIGPDETSDQLEARLARMGATLLVKTLAAIAEGTTVPVSQDDSQATYARKLEKADSRVDWQWPAVRIHNLIRGLHPWPHATTLAEGKRLILHRSRLAGGTSSQPPGTVIESVGEHVRVATGDGMLDLTELQAEGGRPMSAREFLSGHSLPAGTLLTPAT